MNITLVGHYKPKGTIVQALAAHSAAVRRVTALRCAALYSAVLRFAPPRAPYTTLHYAALPCTTLHHTALHCTTLHYKDISIL